MPDENAPNTNPTNGDGFDPGHYTPADADPTRSSASGYHPSASEESPADSTETPFEADAGQSGPGPAGSSGPGPAGSSGPGYGYGPESAAYGPQSGYTPLGGPEGGQYGYASQGGAQGGQYGPGYGPGPGYDAAAVGHYQQGPPAETSSDERTAAVLAHLSGLLSMLLSVGLLSFIGPLIVWAAYKDKSAFVRQAAAGSFNFNLSMALVYFVSVIMLITVIGIPVGIVGIIGAFIAQIVCHVIATSRALNGEGYKYPMQIRVIN